MAMRPSFESAHALSTLQAAHGQGSSTHSELDLVLPDLSSVLFGGITGRSLLLAGLVVCALGLIFGLVIYRQLKRLPVHASMREISELIYETCKTYLVTQGKFILVLWLFIGTIMVVYFGWLRHMPAVKVATILAFSLIGIAGCVRGRLVRDPGQHLRQLAHGLRRAARQALPLLRRSRSRPGMSIGMLLISIELFLMLCVLLFIPRDYAYPCFIGFAIGESLGASRAAHRGRHLHQDRRHRLGPDEDRLQHQGRRRAQPGRDRRLHRRQRRRLGRPDGRRLRDLRRHRAWR